MKVDQRDGLGPLLVHVPASEAAPRGPAVLEDQGEQDAESGLRILCVTPRREDASDSFLRADGKEARFPLDNQPFTDSSSLARYHLFPSETSLTGSVLVAVTLDGDQVLFDLPSGDDRLQLAGRPVVYLDQNQWNALSRCADPSSRLPPAERDAAVRLIELARDGALVLPASSAHYYETTRWADGPARHRLGLTILQLSRGWQMRGPLHVRHDEIRASYEHMHLGGPPARAESVITLMPDVLDRPLPDQPRPPTPPPPHFSPEMAAQSQAALSAIVCLVCIDMMLDRDHIPSVAPTRWVDVNQNFANWLGEQTRPPEQKRASVDALLVADLQQEIAEEAHACGITPQQMSSWVHQRDDHLPALPALGLFRVVLQDRQLNTGLTWRPNDLTDMVYLSTAAAYADVVVCERSIGSALQRKLKQLGRPNVVHRRLRDAVPIIEHMLEGARSETLDPAVSSL